MREQLGKVPPRYASKEEYRATLGRAQRIYEALPEGVRGQFDNWLPEELDAWWPFVRAELEFQGVDVSKIDEPGQPSFLTPPACPRARRQSSAKPSQPFRPTITYATEPPTAITGSDPEHDRHAGSLAGCAAIQTARTCVRVTGFRYLLVLESGEPADPASFVVAVPSGMWESATRHRGRRALVPQLAHAERARRGRERSAWAGDWNGVWTVEPL